VTNSRVEGVNIQGPLSFTRSINERRDEGIAMMVRGLEVMPAGQRKTKSLLIKKKRLLFPAAIVCLCEGDLFTEPGSPSPARASSTSTTEAYRTERSFWWCFHALFATDAATDALSPR
jgi:hypothetical protein